MTKNKVTTPDSTTGPSSAPKNDRRQRRQLALRMQIVTETMPIFKRDGFHSLTMEQIAERCDIAKATLYKYFPVKEAILAAYWQEEMRNSRDEFARILKRFPTTQARLVALLKLFMSRIMENRELYEIYIRYRLQHLNDPETHAHLRSGAERFVMEIIHAGQQSEEIRTDIPALLLVGNFEILSIMQAMMWLQQTEKFSVTTSSRMLVDLFLHGATGNAQS